MHWKSAWLRGPGHTVEEEEEMRTAFGILLFVLVYGPIAYMVYGELTGRRLRVRLPVARSARHRRRTQLQAASQQQH
jgi:hypothetical protein